MDLSKFVAIDSIPVVIQHPAFEDGMEPVFTLAGPCHPATKRADRERMDALTKLRGKKADIEAVTTEHVAARILGWTNVMWDGKELEFSPENARMIMTKPALRFVRDQILAALGDDEAFFKA